MPGTDNAPSLRGLLENAYQQKLKEVVALAKEWANTSHGTRPTIRQWMKEHQPVRDTIELEKWLRPEYDLPEERKRRAQKLTDLCDQTGAPYEITDHFRKAILKRDKGAPLKPGTRRLAILAIEAQRNGGRFSWMRFALANCDCGMRGHDTRCKERIRQAAMTLQRLLRRLGITY